MGYAVRKVSYKQRPWRVVYQSRVGGPMDETAVSEPQWRELGIFSEMSLDEVRARVRQLNAQETLERHAAKRQKIQKRLKVEALVKQAYLRAEDVVEFEAKFLHGHKAKSHWAAASEIICELQIVICDWIDVPHKFYEAFAKRGWSYSYVQKLLPIINKWGYFQAKKYRQAFLPIPYPAGSWKERIDKAYYTKRPNGMVSAPLAPEMLESKRSLLKPAQYNWLAISVWFGLRVHEVDQLKQPTGKWTWWISHDREYPELWIYQTKLTGVKRREMRAKPIPCIVKKQVELLKVIESGELQRPLVKTVQKLFGPDVRLIAGRKGFQKLMHKVYKQDRVDISIWMGHTSLNRTFQDYEDRREYTVKRVKKAA